MNGLKAIETHYNGYRFRSRLEARWAVFMDALGVKYDYEPEGFELPSGRYLPDFWLPSIRGGCWLEIKGIEPTREEEKKAAELARLGNDVLVFFGAIPWYKASYEYEVMMPDFLGREVDLHEQPGDNKLRWKALWSEPRLHTMRTGPELVIEYGCAKWCGGWVGGYQEDDCSLDYGFNDSDYWWCICPKCGQIGIEFNGRGARVCGDACCPDNDKEYSECHPRLLKAYKTARGARFGR